MSRSDSLRACAPSRCSAAEEPTARARTHRTPEDDYVWLGGRPIAYVRGQIASGFTSRTPETYPGPTCSRMGDNLPCGIYPIVTDHIGKPVLALAPNRQIAGLYSYTVHGALNRHHLQGDTPHPYQYPNHNPGGLGSSTCGSNTTEVLAGMTEQAPTTGVGLLVQDAFRHHMVDTQRQCSGFLCGGSAAVDYAEIQDITGGSCLWSPIYQYHLGPYYMGFLGQRADSDTFNEAFYATGQQACPSGNGYICNPCSYCPGNTCSTSCDYPYTGVSLEAVDYRIAQTTTPLSLPLRFPGQYYDAETDLHENWNRFYDPNTGRYFEPEPMWSAGGQSASEVARQAQQNAKEAFSRLTPDGPSTVSMNFQRGRTVPVYSYADDNPLAFVDKNGRGTNTYDSHCENDPAACACELGDCTPPGPGGTIQPEPPPADPPVRPPQSTCGGVAAACMAACSKNCQSGAGGKLGCALTICIPAYIGCLASLH